LYTDINRSTKDIQSGESIQAPVEHMKTHLNSAVKIIPIQEEHIEGFHRCLDEVARERKYLAFVEAPPLEATREFVLGNITRDIPQFVAILDDQVIGFCDIRPNNLEGFRHSGQLGMGVLKSFRRQGIGQALTEAALTKAKEQGLERVELEVYASNLPAIHLYEKMGFRVEGRKKKARKLDGDTNDLVGMALLF
jgi:ribosomal protein S18 acetylase RimI-like enzyme